MLQVKELQGEDGLTISGTFYLVSDNFQNPSTLYLAAKDVDGDYIPYDISSEVSLMADDNVEANLIAKINSFTENPNNRLKAGFTLSDYDNNSYDLQNVSQAYDVDIFIAIGAAINGRAANSGPAVPPRPAAQLRDPRMPRVRSGVSAAWEVDSRGPAVAPPTGAPPPIPRRQIPKAASAPAAEWEVDSRGPAVAPRPAAQLRAPRMPRVRPGVSAAWELDSRGPAVEPPTGAPPPIPRRQVPKAASAPAAEWEVDSRGPAVARTGRAFASSTSTVAASLTPNVRRVSSTPIRAPENTHISLSEALALLSTPAQSQGEGRARRLATAVSRRRPAPAAERTPSDRRTGIVDPTLLARNRQRDQVGLGSLRSAEPVNPAPIPPVVATRSIVAARRARNINPQFGENSQQEILPATPLRPRSTGYRAPASRVPARVAPSKAAWGNAAVPATAASNSRSKKALYEPDYSRPDAIKIGNSLGSQWSRRRAARREDAGAIQDIGSERYDQIAQGLGLLTKAIRQEDRTNYLRMRKSSLQASLGKMREDAYHLLLGDDPISLRGVNYQEKITTALVTKNKGDIEKAAQRLYPANSSKREQIIELFTSMQNGAAQGSSAVTKEFRRLRGQAPMIAPTPPNNSWTDPVFANLAPGQITQVVVAKAANVRPKMRENSQIYQAWRTLPTASRDGHSNQKLLSLLAYCIENPSFDDSVQANILKGFKNYFTENSIHITGQEEILTNLGRYIDSPNSVIPSKFNGRAFDKQELTSCVLGYLNHITSAALPTPARNRWASAAPTPLIAPPRPPARAQTDSSFIAPLFRTTRPSAAEESLAKLRDTGFGYLAEHILALKAAGKQHAFFDLDDTLIHHTIVNPGDKIPGNAKLIETIFGKGAEGVLSLADKTSFAHQSRQNFDPRALVAIAGLVKDPEMAKAFMDALHDSGIKVHLNTLNTTALAKELTKIHGWPISSISALDGQTTNIVPGTTRGDYDPDICTFSATDVDENGYSNPRKITATTNIVGGEGNLKTAIFYDDDFSKGSYGSPTRGYLEEKGTICAMTSDKKGPRFDRDHRDFATEIQAITSNLNLDRMPAVAVRPANIRGLQPESAGLPGQIH